MRETRANGLQSYPVPALGAHGELRTDCVSNAQGNVKSGHRKEGRTPSYKRRAEASRVCRLYSGQVHKGLTLV